MEACPWLYLFAPLILNDLQTSGILTATSKTTAAMASSQRGRVEDGIRDDINQHHVITKHLAGSRRWAYPRKNGSPRNRLVRYYLHRPVLNYPIQVTMPLCRSIRKGK